MSGIYWYMCGKCEVIAQYAEYEDGTASLPRGCFLAHNDDLVTGLKTEADAKEWLEWHKRGGGWPTPGYDVDGNRIAAPVTAPAPEPAGDDNPQWSGEANETWLTEDERRIKSLGIGGFVTKWEQHGLFTTIAALRAENARLRVFVQDVINNAPADEPLSLSMEVLPAAWSFWGAGSGARELLRQLDEGNNA